MLKHDFSKITITVYRSYISTAVELLTSFFDGCLKGASNVGTATTTYNYTVPLVTDVATYIPDATCGAGSHIE
jgi:hypothetical protein